MPHAHATSRKHDLGLEDGETERPIEVVMGEGGGKVGEGINSGLTLQD